MHANSLQRELEELLGAEAWRRQALAAVAALGLPDCWIGAGFVRSPVWDRLHGFETATPLDDVDIIYFDPLCLDPDVETLHEARLAARGPKLPWPQTRWSVTNQARMHLEKGEPPYTSSADALSYWLETPTAVAARLGADGEIEILAPFGLDDLFAMVMRPTPYARARQPDDYRARVARKGWGDKWPRVRLHLP